MTQKVIRILIILSLLLVGWEMLGKYFPFSRLLLSSPSRIVDYLIVNRERLLLDLGHTFSVAFFGLLIASILGFLLAFFALKFKRLSKPMMFISSIAQTIPIIVFVPFLVITMGSNFYSKVILACLMSLFVILINTIVNIEKARNEYKEFLMLYDVHVTEQYTKVLIPISMASIVGSIRIAASLSVLGAVVVEFTGSTYGLGKNIFLSSVRLEPELMVISVVLCALLGAAVHYIFLKVEKKYFWWH